MGCKDMFRCVAVETQDHSIKCGQACGQAGLDRADPVATTLHSNVQGLQRSGNELVVIQRVGRERGDAYASGNFQVAPVVTDRLGADSPSNLLSQESRASWTHLREDNGKFVRAVARGYVLITD